MTAPNDSDASRDRDDRAEDPAIARVVRLQRASGILAWVGAALGLIGAIWALVDGGFANASGVAWWWFLIFAAALALVGATTNARIRFIRRNRSTDDRAAEPDENGPPAAST